MWLYYFSLFISLVLFIYGLIIFSFKSGNKGLKEHFKWSQKHKIKIWSLAGVLFIAVTLIFYIPIKKSVLCSYKGFEHSVETRYSLFSGNCNYLGRNGEWIPIWKLVGIAEGTGDADKSASSSNDDPKA